MKGKIKEKAFLFSLSCSISLYLVLFYFSIFLFYLAYLFLLSFVFEEEEKKTIKTQATKYPRKGQRKCQPVLGMYFVWVFLVYLSYFVSLGLWRSSLVLFIFPAKD